MNIKGTVGTYGPAFLSGCLLVLCFPAIDLFYLAWVVLVPFLISLYDKTVRESFVAGLVFGFPYFFGTLYWIYHSINHYGGVSFVSSTLIVFLLCLYLSLYAAVFAFLFSITIRRRNLPAVLVAPVYWVVLEFLRSYIFTGFPWSSIGYSQYKFLMIIQIADITGVYGVSFLVLAVNGALADLFLIKKRTSDMPLFPLSYSVIGIFILSLLIASSLLYGNLRLKEERPGISGRVSVAQGNIDQDKKWEPSYQNAVIDTYKSLSLEAVSSSPSIIIWPETAVPFFFGADREYTDDLIEFQKGLNVHLLFGSVLVKNKTSEDCLLSNSAVLLDTDGKVTYIYDKIHLVPFGEYVPLHKLLFFISKLVVGIGD
ncbi:MAG: apolipoprotein N-acyltransferase, partial [Nitrospirota bacterium]